MAGTFPGFLKDLFDTGRVVVPQVGPIAREELQSADDVLAATERLYRRELPGEPPTFHAAAARWAAVSLYQACQLVVFRDEGAEAIDRLAQSRCPHGDPPSVHYSADVTFRFLPDLWRLARHRAEEDPLLVVLKAWAAQWPLSSVGMPGIEAVEIDAVAGYASLLAHYADRIVARRDVSRLADPRAGEAVAAALGGLPELAPELAAALEKVEHP